jgi:hypothetical protein
VGGWGVRLGPGERAARGAAALGWRTPAHARPARSARRRGRCFCRPPSRPAPGPILPHANTPPEKVLLDLLGKEFPLATDFSRDILPAVIGERRIVAFPHTSVGGDGMGQSCGPRRAADAVGGRRGASVR